MAAWTVLAAGPCSALGVIVAVPWCYATAAKLPSKCMAQPDCCLRAAVR